MPVSGAQEASTKAHHTVTQQRCQATGEVLWECRNKAAPAQSGYEMIKKVLGTQEK